MNLSLRFWRAGAVAALCVGLAAIGETASAQGIEAQPPLTFGVTGSVSLAGDENPTNLLARRSVQALILRAAEGGITEGEASQALADADVTLDQIERAQLLRNNGEGRYLVSFNLITAADRARLDSVIAPRARDLANQILRRRSRFERIIAAYDLPGIDRREVLFALIGCVGLDWDGLTVTAEQNYRTPAPSHANGDRYIIWAREAGPNVSYRGLYWGSHNDERSQVGTWFTTFGDHDALPRSGLPDAVWESYGAVARNTRLALAGRRALGDVVFDRLDAVLDPAAAAMMRLRDGPADSSTLSAAAGADAEAMAEALHLLAAFGYVREQNSVYSAAVPVFAERDRAMIEAVRAQTRTVMVAWLRTNAESMRRELSDLSALRAGVPYEQLYTEIWHHLFGAANARLSEAGFFIDPYAEDARWVGFAPFVHASSLSLNN